MPVRVVGAHIASTKELLEICQAVVNDPELVYDLILLGLGPVPRLLLSRTLADAGNQVWI